MSLSSGSFRVTLNEAGGSCSRFTLTDMISPTSRGTPSTLIRQAGTKMSEKLCERDMPSVLLQGRYQQRSPARNGQRIVDVAGLRDRTPLPRIVILLRGNALERVAGLKDALLRAVGRLQLDARQQTVDEIIALERHRQRGAERHAEGVET